MPHPRVDLFNFRTPKIEPVSVGQDTPSAISVLEEVLLLNSRGTYAIYEVMQQSGSLDEYLAWARSLGKIISMGCKFTRSIHKLEQEQAYLPGLARDASILIKSEFVERGIPEHPLFVPLELINFRANLDAGGPLLTDLQWLLIKESFTTLREDVEYFRKYRHRKPRPAPRLLFEAVLLKLACDLRWEDLSAAVYRLHPDLASFPLRLCQRLYRDLFNTGRLQAIHKMLLWSLQVYGDSTLQDLVAQGCFRLGKKIVNLAPGQALTWQLFTALLILQRAHHNRCRIQRENDNDRRGRGAYLRLPSLRRTGRPRLRAGAKRQRSRRSCGRGPAALAGLAATLADAASSRRSRFFRGRNRLVGDMTC
jgi:hypothetical protein